MNLTYAKRKKIFTVEERVTLLNECEELLNKNVMLLSVKEAGATNRHKLKIQVGKVDSIDWSSFCNYPEFNVRMFANDQIERVDAAKWGYTLFTDVDDLITSLKGFMDGDMLDLIPTLERSFVFKDFLWPTKGGIITTGNCQFCDKNQVLGFDMTTGIIEVVKMELQGITWKMSNGVEYSIKEPRLNDTESYKYYGLNSGLYGLEYLVADEFVDSFENDIKSFISNQMLLNKEIESTEIEIEESLVENNDTVMLSFSKDELRRVMSEVIFEKVPDTRFGAVMLEFMQEVTEDVLEKLQY